MFCITDAHQGTPTFSQESDDLDPPLAKNPNETLMSEEEEEDENCSACPIISRKSPMSKDGKGVKDPKKSKWAPLKIKSTEVIIRCPSSRTYFTGLKWSSIKNKFTVIASRYKWIWGNTRRKPQLNFTVLFMFIMFLIFDFTVLYFPQLWNLLCWLKINIYKILVLIILQG